jgi:lipoyl(octanoyl) transferase
MIQYLYLGRVAYDEALRLQEELVELRRQDRIANTLLLLEHPPVLTLGRNASRANILAPDELLRSRGVTLHEINRGGDVTFHGPGQLVGYPIFDLRALVKHQGGRMGPVDFVRLMEEALIRLCEQYGVPAGRIAGLTGVWCGGGAESGTSSLDPKRAANGAASAPTASAESVSNRKKIAAIGIHVSRGITSHGFAFNLSTDLSGFSLIHPCGIAGCRVTSLTLELLDPAAAPTLETLAHEAARQFGAVFSEPVMAIESLAALRAAAGAASAVEAEAAPGQVPAPEFPAQEFPAEDTPLQIPPEVERLRGARERPARA